MALKKICVVGAGTMGSGITQAIAQAGYDTMMTDIKPELVERGKNIIRTSLARFVKKGTMKPEDADRILSGIRTSTDLNEAARDADYVIEAVFETPEAKLPIFQQLENVCRTEAILASNTSGIPISLLASATKRPDKVIGLHFMNPVPVMKGVEVVRALLTSDETLNTSLELVKTLGKESVIVRDSPGFITNRMIALMANEGAHLFEEGLASVEDIDKISCLSFNWPMGPLQMADLIGVDTLVNILEGIYQQTGWERYKPARILKRMAESGYTGRKSGKGFYEMFVGK